MITLRQHLAINAPKILSWFKPKGIKDYSHEQYEHPGGLPHVTTAIVGCCSSCDTYFKKKEDFEKEKRKGYLQYTIERLAQWPWFYADSVISQQGV